MLVVRTFGGLAVEHDGTVCEGAAARRKTLALLALLAVAGKKGLSRDKLIGYLWPETETLAARHLLKQSCYALRHDLGEPALLLGRDDLRLNPAVVSSDIQAFEAALESGDRGRAAALYTGPFLDGFYLNGADEFERWVEAERARIAQRACAALEAVAGEAAAHGDHTGAADLWRRPPAPHLLYARVAPRPAAGPLPPRRSSPRAIGLARCSSRAPTRPGCGKSSIPRPIAASWSWSSACSRRPISDCQSRCRRLATVGWICPRCRVGVTLERRSGEPAYAWPRRSLWSWAAFSRGDGCCSGRGWRRAMPKARGSRNDWSFCPL